jgi:hypothetical protein
MLRPGLLDESELQALEPAVRLGLESLVAVGALERTQRGLGLRRSAEPMVRDLLEPLAFRLWRRVEGCRQQIALSSMPPELASGYLAAELGVDETQALRHLSSAPVQQLRVPESITPTSRSEKKRMLYQRNASEPLPCVEEDDSKSSELEMDYPTLNRPVQLPPPLPN